MNSEDQEYGPQEETIQEGERYSPENRSHNPENRRQDQRRRGGPIGNRIKQNLRNRLDPRKRFSSEGIRQQIREVRRDFLKKIAKEGVKKAALNPYVWLVMGIIALIIFLVIIISGIDDEEDCTGGGGTAVATELVPGEEPPHDYKRTTYGGKTVNQRTKLMLENAAKIAGVKTIPITQGSYNKGGVAASAGTHDGGGVVDIADTSDKMVKALRIAGFAAWARGAPFSPHIHAVAIGDKELAPGAAAQVINYFDGLDGLAGNGKDNAPASVGRPFPEWAQKYADGAQASGGSDIGGCEGATGEVTKDYVAPSDNDCGGKYKTNSPIGKNFGDPKCSFTKDELHKLLKELDSANADRWFSKVAPCESQYNPNAFNGNAVDAAGAWGLYQMGSAKPPGAPPPAPGKNGPTDRGDVNWELQSSNAVAYQKKAGWGYWACK